MEPDLGAQELLARLARDLQHDASSADVAQRVVDAATQLVPACVSAGVSVARRSGSPTTAASTGGAAVRADLLQVESQQGPCFDAGWAEAQVTTSDLLDDDRWPRWGRLVAEELGVRSLLCVRLFTHHGHLGALSLYAVEPNAFTDDDLDTALALAAHSSVAVAQAAAIEQLHTALDSRTVIGQAVGLTMREHGLPSHDAFHVLTRLSSHQNRKLVTIARELVARHDFDAVVQAQVDASLVHERTEPKPGPR